MPLHEVAVRLRRKNQVTLPEPIVAQLKAEPGDQLIFGFHDERPGQLEVRRLRESYAGVANGIYGNEEEVAEYLREERASWGE